MDNNEIIEKALKNAREMQRSIGDAAAKQRENMTPLIEQSMKSAKELQATLTKHAQESAMISQEQTQRALGHLQNFMRIGTDAMRSSAEQARTHVQQMMDQSKKAAESTAEAVGKNARDVKP
ncbi:MAG: hypothetical protein M3Z14_03245 [Candidatus Eremiobacteraeota bacterium]|nr:hypothetical protein [Candidatus Eremiobacteraeota bacterium]